MEGERINLWVKRVRADVIAEHLARLGQRQVVCFTCGNAAEALRRAGLLVVSVGDNEDLKPGRWFSYTDIAQTWPGVFDATSGHLPLPLLVQVALRLRAERPIYSGAREVLTGSGETYVCLSLAYPHMQFVPVYNASRGSRYEAGAPLNGLVALLAQGAVGAGQ